VSRVVVHIDRLVVSGTTDDRAVETAVREAVARELSRPGAVERMVAAGSRATVDAGRVVAGEGAGAIGAAVARGIAGGGR
jgi:nicotinamidase-related amidase